tara:strand:+ start:1324 stop:2274 length:951 start_codon:yes stop_codon:yes gene_type:complete
MARISTYAIDGLPTVNDKVIGTDAENADVTMNYTIGDIIGLVPGGASSVQSLNTLTGALTLVGAGGNTITVSGTTITITGTPSSGGGLVTSLTTVGTSGASTLTGGVLNIPNYTTSGGGGGTVTDVSVLVNGGVTDAIDLRVFNPTTTPRIELDFNGVAGQYINGLGVLTTSDFMTTLTTNGTSGAASYDAPTNTLNIPVITGGSTLPYTTYVARYSTNGTSASPQELENTTGGTFIWSRKTGLSEQIEIVFSGVLGSSVLILCNGRGGDKAGGVQAFYNTTDNNSTILIDILDSNFTPSALDIIEGMFELRIYDK